MMSAYKRCKISLIKLSRKSALVPSSFLVLVFIRTVAIFLKMNYQLAQLVLNW